MQPALNWLVGKAPGYYVPTSTVLESDFERTSGVALTGDGTLRPNRSFDFVDERGIFGRDGKTTGRLQVGWWGSCDKVATAGMLFQAPKKTVTLDEISFSAHEIQGLLAIIAESQARGSEYVGYRFKGIPNKVHLTNGQTIEGELQNYKISDLRNDQRKFSRTGNILERQGCDRDIDIKLPSGEIRTIGANKISRIEMESKEEPSAIEFHETILKWLGEKRPFAMDISPGTSVWNYCYDQADIQVSPRNETLAKNAIAQNQTGDNGPIGTGKQWEVVTRLEGANPKVYTYWFEVKNNEVVNSGWISESPAFLWRPKASEAKFKGHNKRNPFVLPELVKEIYSKSV